MIRLLFVICILLRSWTYAQPSFNLESFNDENASRPSGSKRGVVNGVDRYVIYATVSKNDGDSNDYPDNGIMAQMSKDGNTGWTDIQLCGFDLSKCGPQSDLCYCESLSNNEYKLALAFTADEDLSSAYLRLTWGDLVSNKVQLPNVCGPITSTYQLGEHARTLLESTPNVVAKPSGTISLQFCVTGLEAIDFIAIDMDGLALSSTNTKPCTSTFMKDEDTGKVFTLAFQESVQEGCGRSGKYALKAKHREDKKAPAKSGNADKSMGGGVIAGIVIGSVALLGLLIVIVTKKGALMKLIKSLQTIG